jgi:hypothetical protein
MGGGTFNSSSYRSFASSTVGKSTAEVFTSRSIKKSLDPKGVKIRESRDSVDSPAATPIIIAFDETGSMGKIPDAFVREGLGIVIESILARKPVTNPSLMVMAFGDVECDQSPLQVSQFEADNRIVQQLTEFYLEGNGGGNGHESYELPWYFAAYHTEHDSLIKRGKRGYLFTVGDEPIGPGLKKSELKQFLEDGAERDYSSSECLEAAQRMYDCYHIVIKQGSHARGNLQGVLDTWQPLLGQHVIQLEDYTKLGETIVSTIEIAEGADAHSATSGWGASASVVLDAVKHLPKGAAPKMLGAR